MFSLIAIVYVLFYLTVLGGILFLIYSWVMRYFKLKEEQNQILREISDKLDSKK